ncbi:MAG: transcriptional repressor LexA [Pelobacteraceae bacterium]
MIQLTDRQKMVFDFIGHYQKQHGYPPTMQEIAGHLNINGNLGVMRHLTALEKKGYLTRTPGSSRSIRLTSITSDYQEMAERIGDMDHPSVFLPVVGTVRAGMPQPPVEDIQEYYSVDRTVARSGGTFFLKVTGDSMINAAISEGDLALIRPQSIAQDRDIVVALVDGEATLKRFYRESNHIRLQPENPAYDPIVIRAEQGEVTIVGKMVGLFRNME